MNTILKTFELLFVVHGIKEINQILFDMLM